MSYCLSTRGIDHVVLERGRLAERWRSERWDSLRLLTPNWQTRLPGFQYDGPDPDGFMASGDVVDFLERYARSFSPPLESQTSVTSVWQNGEGFQVATSNGDWRARAVVIATGDCDVPMIPRMSGRLSPGILQIAPSRYRRPEMLPDGGVLVVGASSTGIQLADELSASGRDVIIAAGHHTRMPRQYRGRDIMWWLDRAGLMDASTNEVHELELSRNQPSLQLVGRPDHASLDLSVLRDRGVRVTGRLVDFDASRARFADDLLSTTVASDVKLAALLTRLDAAAERPDFGFTVSEPTPFVPIWPRFTTADTSVDLAAENIRTVIWAVGYRRIYNWLDVPVLDAHGEILHDGGVTPHPGLYVIGLRFLRRRNSTFIDGVGKDAVVLSDHVAAYLDRTDQQTTMPMLAQAGA
jgi:putative flavoprotein involved in K+ transport